MGFDGRKMIDYFADQSGGGTRDDLCSLDRLMALHDDLFVAAAYDAILRRQADPIGLAYYAGRLRSGFSRISVMDQLVRSPEARADWRDLPGLEAAIARYRKSRGLGGWRLALSDPELGRTPSLRRARVLQNSLSAQRQMVAQAMEQLAAVSPRQAAGRGEDQNAGGLSNKETAAGERAYPFEPPCPRRIGDVRYIDLPAQVRAIVGQLPC